MESAKSMKLYDRVERIHNELRELGIPDDAPLTVEQLVPFDQYHYHGTEAVDEAARRVTVSGANVDLSPREFSLLEALLRHAGQTLTRDQLLDHAWPFSVAVTPNAVDAYVHYLRTKLGAAGSQLETVRGVGYRLADG